MLGLLQPCPDGSRKGCWKQYVGYMYIAINPSTDTPVCDKFELGSNISSSYIGWHTALEIHGLAHQPFYNAYIGSISRFMRYVDIIETIKMANKKAKEQSFNTLCSFAKPMLAIAPIFYK